MNGKSYMDEVKGASKGGVFVRGDVEDGTVVKNPKEQRDDGSSTQTIKNPERDNDQPSR